MSERSLFPVAALVRNAAQRFEFRVRWLLGDEHEDLPRRDDAFDVAIRIAGSDRYVRGDGTLGAAGVVEKIRVRPKLFAMVDPPRDRVPYPIDPNETWEVARKPAQAIDCGDTLVERITEGFGICHLLGETQSSRVQARVERLLEPQVSRAMSMLHAKSASPRFAAAQGDDTVRKLAEMLVRRAPRPMHLQRFAIEEHARLVEATRSGGGVEALAGVRAFGNGDLAERWSNAALLFELVRDPALLAALDEQITPPQKTRQQIRLRALQGGKLLDYWCSPDTQGVCTDAARGKQYPASELIGTGLTVGSFTAAELQDWLDAAGGNMTAVEVRVEHIRTVTPVVTAADGTVLDVMTAEDGPFDPRMFEIYISDLALAIASGSSNPPAVPVRASVNFDFLQTNAGFEEVEGKEGRDVQLAYVTGDARVEVVITPGRTRTFNQLALGFNVYGMWETAATKKFFDDPARQPSPDELRPWLITRKYSFERDLKGAFPPIGSTPHPALQAALGDPPWQPLLTRMDSLTNVNDGKRAPLPDVFRKDGDVRQVRFDLDLRRGMESGGGTFVGWDPDASPRFDWDPSRTRDGVAAGARPQRYRFWATSIDAFEQESEPVPVRGSDVDAGEAATTLFTPRIRAAILAPPATEKALALNGRTLLFTAEANGRFRITVQWDTPFLNDLGRREAASGSARRAVRNELVGALKLFRRRLRRKVDDAALALSMRLLANAEPAASIFALPQWADAIAKLEGEGWNECGSAENIAPPSAGDVWKHELPFDHAARGFEYVALVGMTVRADRAAFWAPDALGTRKAYRAVKTETGWAPDLAHVTETPRTSTAVMTEGWRRSTEGADVVHTGPLPVANVALPRGVALARAQFHRALPILAPPGISRDAVLLRLLTRPVAGDAVTALAPQPWADTGIELTVAQTAMLEAALERSAAQTGIDDVVKDPRLRETRLLLARELVADPKEGGGYRQSMTVGFRGLVELDWTYTPFAMRAPLVTEAEAEKLRVYGVRVPRAADAATRYATVLARGHRTNGTWELQNVAPEQQPGLEAIERFRQPALVRITAANATFFGALTALETMGGRTTMRVEGLDATALPVDAAIAIYAAQPLADVSIDDFAQPTQRSTFLPAGGGPDEVFGFWLQTISAQEVVSSHAAAARPFFIHEGTATIEPEAPLDVRVNVAPASTAAFALSVTTDRAWLPRMIATDDQAQHDPRVLLTWEALAGAARAGLEVEREERLLEQEPPSALASAFGITPWEAISALDKLTDDLLIQRDWVAAIRTNWLLGKAVDVPESGQGMGAILIPAAVVRPLDAIRGVKQLTLPGGTARPAFIDYFRHAANDALAMDGNYEYRYRVRAYIDVLEGATPNDANEWRFLRSRPTPWTEWILPEPSDAAFNVRALPAQERDADTPAVELRISAAAAQVTAAGADDDQHWFYRVVVRRQLDAALPSDPSVTLEPRWREVGAPALIRPDGGTITLLDSLVERSDAAKPVTVSYQLTGRQLVRMNGRERVVRALRDVTIEVVIPPPANIDSRKEKVAVSAISIL